MANFFEELSGYRFRWIALAFISLGLAIIIIDNTVLNVAIPYILRDMNASLDALQWVISGYSLIIATLLITMGRLGDLWGRKRVFLLGAVLFAIGSFIASIAPNPLVLFVGEALVEAVGASMLMTSSLALLAGEFQGKERALAFGVWGSVAGVAASIGPLLGGYLTTYFSWRWSLRINVFVALVVLIGSIFIKESKVEGEKGFDFLGTLFSGLGLFSLIFGFIEETKYGFWQPNQQFSIGNFVWPLSRISVIPFAFLLAAIYLFLFFVVENSLEKLGKTPLLRLSIFKNSGFSISLITLGIVSLGQFGVFFTLPIYLQNALGLDAFKTGLVFLSTSIAVLIFGPLSGVVASKIGPKWVVSIGMFLLALGAFLLHQSISANSTGLSLAPSFFVFGMGVGAASAQLTNLVISAVSLEFAGEASATNSTIRQVGTSIGVAILGTILASSVTANINTRLKQDNRIPEPANQTLRQELSNYTPGQGDSSQLKMFSPDLRKILTEDINNALVDASKNTLLAALIPIFLGALVSLLIPGASHSPHPNHVQESVTNSEHAKEYKKQPENPAIKTP